MAPSAKRARQPAASQSKKKAKASPPTPGNASLQPTNSRPRTSSHSATTNDPDWLHGNFKVTTADGVVFVVDDFVLMSASPVFADAPSFLSTQTGLGRTRSKSTGLLWGIEFIDPEIETAPVVKWFLTIATSLKVTFTSVQNLGPLLLFMRKWGADALYNLVHTELLIAIPISKDVLPPLKMFNIGAILDDLEICMAVLRAVRQGDKDPGWSRTTNTITQLFDPRCWTARFWREQAIPPEYMFALVSSLGPRREATAERFEAALIKAGRTPLKKAATAF